ncbi:hypothetical protein FZEAL_1058 [Fusarium zealandicum]|uniref:Uncharacterized protein n=1 Tax=Fusarium zealandicum TaxID=1053134 RepID=A0A8H4UTG1_9HYPO|nr:hypothetical protein FZEAL_1058 [Fusarium zealandicum]
MEGISSAFGTGEPVEHLDPDAAAARFNPAIAPKDSEWKSVYGEFTELLDSSKTINQIMSEYFTHHEARLFFPSDRADLKKLQDDNTERYNALLAGRLKGVDRSLASKLTMLYFGLPIEPMENPLDDLAMDLGLKEPDHPRYNVEPPLHFLTAHDSRNWGKESLTTKVAPNYPLPIPQETEPIMGLRGGDFEHELSDYCPDTETPALPQDEWIYLYGYNGCVPFVPRKWRSYSSAVRQLLGLNETDTDPSNNPEGREYALIFFGRKANESEFISDTLPLQEDSEAMHFLRQHFTDRSTSGHAGCCAFFVKTPNQPTPHHWEPQKEQFNTDLTKIGRNVFAVANGAGSDAISYAYLPFPKTKTTSFTIESFASNQFNAHFNAAIHVLFGKPRGHFHHALFRLFDKNRPTASEQIPAVYGGMGQMQWVMEKLHPLNNPDACWMVDHQRLGDGDLPIILPGYYPNPHPYVLSATGKTGMTPFSDTFKAVQDIITEAFDAETLAKMSSVMILPSEVMDKDGDYDASTGYKISTEEPYQPGQQKALGQAIESMASAGTTASYLILVPLWYPAKCRLFPNWADQLGYFTEMPPLSSPLDSLWTAIDELCEATQHKKDWRDNYDYVLLKALPPFDSLEVPKTDSPAYLINSSITDMEWVTMRASIIACDLSVSLLRKRDVDWGSTIPKSNAWGPRVNVDTPNVYGLGVENLHEVVEIEGEEALPATSHFTRGAATAAKLPFVKPPKRKVDGYGGKVQAGSSQRASAFLKPSGWLSKGLQYLPQPPLSPSAAFNFTFNIPENESGYSPIPGLGRSANPFAPSQQLRKDGRQLSGQSWSGLPKSQAWAGHVEEEDELLGRIQEEPEQVEERRPRIQWSSEVDDEEEQLEGPDFMDLDNDSVSSASSSAPSIPFDAPIHSLPGKFTPMPSKGADLINKDDRTSTWATQPSIFDDWDPNAWPSCTELDIPITAAPLEKVLRTSNNVPMVSKAILTPSEQAELQRSFWKVRNIALKRAVECPFKGCDFTYRLDEQHVIEKHAKTAHQAQRCMWCYEPLFEWWDEEQRTAHLQKKHKTELVKALGIKTGTFKKSRDGRFRSEPVHSTDTHTRRAENAEMDDIFETSRPDPLSPTPVRGTWARPQEITPSARGRFAPQPKQQTAQASATRGNVGQSARATTQPSLPDDVNLRFVSEQLEKIRQQTNVLNLLGHENFPPTQGMDFGTAPGSAQPDPTKLLQDVRDLLAKSSSASVPQGTAPRGIIPPLVRRQDKEAIPNPLDPVVQQQIFNNAWQTKRSQPPRLLAYPLPWHDEPGPEGYVDPPTACPDPRCKQPCIEYSDSREVWEHFQKHHPMMKLNSCPFCHLSFIFSAGEDDAGKRVYKRRPVEDCIKHFDCHVYRLWDILMPQTSQYITSKVPFSNDLMLRYPNGDQPAAEHPLKAKMVAYWASLGKPAAEPLAEPAEELEDEADGSWPGLKCAWFETCGTLVDSMTEKQLRKHMKDSHRKELAMHDSDNDEEEVEEEVEELVPRAVPHVRSPIPKTRRAHRSLEDMELDIPEAVTISSDEPPSTTSRTTPGVTARGRSPAVQRMTPKPLLAASHHDSNEEELYAADDAPATASRDRRRQEKQQAESTEQPSPAEEELNTMEGESRSSATRGRARPTKRSKTSRPAGENDGEYEDEGSDEDDEVIQDEQGVMHRRRARSPDWIKELGPSDPDFDPDDDMYCSKCLRKAPKRRGRSPHRHPMGREKELEFHTDKTRCCKIRNGKGFPERLPNRSGWIRAADLPSKLGRIKETFKRRYPAYERTVYPTKAADHHASVWRSDPNNEDNKDWWDMPWPPFEGRPPFPGSWVDPGMPQGGDGTGRAKSQMWQGRPERDTNYRYQSDSDSADDLKPDEDDIGELQSNDASSAGEEGGRGLKRRRTGEAAATTLSQPGVDDTPAEEGGPSAKKAKKSPVGVDDGDKPISKTPKRARKTVSKAGSQPSRASSRVRQQQTAGDKSRNASPAANE